MEKKHQNQLLLSEMEMKIKEATITNFAKEMTMKEDLYRHTLGVIQDISTAAVSFTDLVDGLKGNIQNIKFYDFQSNIFRQCSQQYCYASNKAVIVVLVTFIVNGQSISSVFKQSCIKIMFTCQQMWQRKTAAFTNTDFSLYLKMSTSQRQIECIPGVKNQTLT